MSPTAIGGPVRLVDLPEPEAIGIEEVPRWRYAAAPKTGDSYRVRLAPVRLSALVTPSDMGFVAEAPELGVLGYGESREAALDDLQDAIHDYLLVLKEKRLALAPQRAHHGRYLQLLETPDSWFAAVTVRTRSAQDATNLE